MQTVDVSTSGMSVLAARALDAGQRRELSFGVPVHGVDSSLTAVAQSVYRVHGGLDGFKIGMRFVENAAHTNTASLHQFIERA